MDLRPDTQPAIRIMPTIVVRKGRLGHHSTINSDDSRTRVMTAWNKHNARTATGRKNPSGYPPTDDPRPVSPSYGDHANMMHSAPKPLTIALDMAKRIHHELARHMTPEQRRDFTRIERLIAEAQKQHQAQLIRSRQEAVTSPAPVAPRRRSIWPR